jgi:hypothetical protein
MRPGHADRSSLRLAGRLPLVIVLAGAVTAGCLETRLVRTLKPPDQVKTLDRRSPYLKIHMKDGGLYVLAKWRVDDAAREVSGDGERFSLSREVVASGAFRIAIDEIALLETNVVQRSGAAVALAVITGVSAAVTAVCIANPKTCFGSCPTFYIADGNQLALQAEGFSSSIAPSLEARDVDALYRVNATRPVLAVTMKNEALETHVVRHVRLLAAERPAAGRVLRTVTGEFQEATNLKPIERCRASEGDCRAKTRAFDDNERFSSTDDEDLARREIIDLQMIPDGPMGLVIASRQTLASTYIFYQSLAWLGRSASDTLAALERGDSAVGLGLARLGNVLGGIEVLAEVADGSWMLAGEVREMGPLASDVVVVPLPAVATGHVRLRLARGHWRIDYLASARLGGRVHPVAIEPHSVLSPSTTIDQAEGPLTTLPGDTYTYSFRLPDDPRRYELFLESQGYYLEWLRDEWLLEENQARAAQLLLNPEQLLRDIAPEFKKQEARIEKLFWGSRYARR